MSAAKLLSAAVVCMLGASLCGTAPATSATRVDSVALARNVLAELVRIDTVEPAGSTQAAQVLAEHFKAAGFPSEDVQILAPKEHPQKANLVVRLRGRGTGKPILWMAHLDVVAADAAEWSVAPFRLSEREGWLYGRGTADMKGEIAAIVAALIRLKREGFTPDRDILAAFTADEEAAGRVNGVRWLLAQHRSLFDVALAINPDGGGGVMVDGQRRYYKVQTAEKAYATYTLSASDAGGHSSRPRPGNPIYRLAAALVRLDAHRFEPRLSATTRAFFRDGAALEPEPLRSDMLALGVDQPTASAFERMSTRPALDALIRTTCVATLLEAGEAENALPQSARATIQCRLLPDEDPHNVLATLRRVIADPSVEVAVAKPPLISPETVPDPHVLGAIRTVVTDMWGPLPVVTGMDAGGSDAVFTRAAGIPTYGAGSIFEEAEDDRHHGRDERIEARAFEQGIDFTCRLMRALSAMKATSES
ncbi:MAG TPA: M20/M25/M40 family metallo-hydrolase [Steroidobacteraceae bacterium]|jgi:acetylornithine deacetylase/succinyl-diaminopimelate desuccinylase-like protein